MTFPRRIRFLLARDPKLLGRVLGLFVRTLFAWQRRAARKDGYPRVLPGAISFVQNFGSALNCNVHIQTEVPSPSPARRSSLFEELPLDEEMGSEVPWEIVENGSDEDPRTRAPP